jgi:DNA-binding response OmpR family regulator
VIEGDPAIALFMDEYLTVEGYRTHLWTESAGAAEFVRTLQPDLVILDLWIRRRGDGLSILEQLRKEGLTRSTPIIVWSTDIQMLEEQGAHLDTLDCACLMKPFVVADLLVLVKTCLREINTIVTAQPARCLDYL